MSTTLDAPVSANERIDVIDILRGMALFGILTANMRGFFAPSEVYFNVGALYTGTVDTAVQTFLFALFQGKFITLFAFLFGLGFAVQMTRADERGKSVWFYPRRMLVLLCIGLIHAWVIWWGDILVDYAVFGTFLLLFRKSKPKTIAIWSASLFALPVVMTIGFYCAFRFWGIKPPGPNGPGNPAELQTAIQHGISVFRDGSWLSRIQLTFTSWRDHHTLPGPIFLGLFVMARFLAGLWVWRIGLLKNVSLYLPKVRQVWKWALAIGLAADGLAFILPLIFKLGGTTPTLTGTIVRIGRDISLPAIACFYACSVLLLVQHPVWKARLAPFGAVGRMALTNYLLESIICTNFYHYTKLYGKVGPALGLIPTVVLFSLQIPFSVWWLKHYQFGPMEWLWRSLTYGKFQSMKRVPPPSRKLALL
jgi:Predicted membrane protein